MLKVDVEMSENTFSTQLNNTFRYSGLKIIQGCPKTQTGHLSFIELWVMSIKIKK